MTTERKLIDFDPVTGIQEDYVYDRANDTIILEHTQDVKPLIEEVQRVRNASQGWKADYVPVAHLSGVQCLELMKIGIMDRGYAIRDEVAFGVWLDAHNKMKATEGHF